MTKLVFKVPSAGHYSRFKFPLKLRPQDDELLSSWLVRLALLHRTMPMTFTNLYMPESKNRFWSVDFDLQADPEMLAALSLKCGAPAESLLSMTLGSFEGYLVERIYRRSGGTPFITPLGMRGRRCTLPGLRYCPLCLREDAQPYFRKKWRLAFSVLCRRHGCYLLDRCPNCEIPLTPYLACKSGKVEICYSCGKNILGGKVELASEGNGIFIALEKIYSVLDEGFTLIEGNEVRSHLYFQVLHQILRLMASKRYGPRLQEGVDIERIDVYRYKNFESVPLLGQAWMLVKAAWLLDEWPQRFVEICQRQKLFSSVLLKDFEQAPFWYWQVVGEKLFHPDKVVTNGEINEAAKHLANNNLLVSEASLSKLLGVNQVFRKRTMILGDLIGFKMEGIPKGYLPLINTTRNWSTSK